MKFVDDTVLAMEQALVEDPDDLASHMAYADYLHDKGDPRGELIQIQLALEDENHSPHERKKLQAREEKLLKKHEREWVGELAPWLTDQKGLTLNGHQDSDEEYRYTFKRGWIDTIISTVCSPSFTARLARSPESRLLRHLAIRSEEGSYDTSDELIGTPDRDHWLSLFPLLKAENLSNVRIFEVGELDSWENPSEEYNCDSAGIEAVQIIKKMPRIEELYLLASEIDMSELFSLRTLNQLRILLVYHMGAEYPLSRLAKNPSLSNLTHLLLYPHGSPGMYNNDEPYLTNDGIKAVLRSKHLTSLTHLQLRMSDFGDKGCKELVNSGRLQQLKFLDLRLGFITDEGANALAECEDIGNLDYLNVARNQISPEAVCKLKAKVTKIDASDQFEHDHNRESIFEEFVEGDGE